jgi:hypothetical protein
MVTGIVRGEVPLDPETEGQKNEEERIHQVALLASQAKPFLQGKHQCQRTHLQGLRRREGRFLLHRPAVVGKGGLRQATAYHSDQQLRLRPQELFNHPHLH